jgi:osmoprotectant transport system permease protein
VTGFVLADGNPGGPVIPSFGDTPSCISERTGHWCWPWIRLHWRDTLLTGLVQHLELVGIAIAIGFVIAFAAAVLAYRYRQIETPVGLLAAFLYTVPSIAAFEILLPITGITWTTVEIPLVSYTLLILFRNILTGLRGVPDEALEAARGMGLTDRQMLWRVQLPLALPAIVAGVRIAVVTTISLATIAAFINPIGLGKPIFDGIQDDFDTKVLAAGGLAIALALVADLVLVGVQRVVTPWARLRRAS